MGELRDDELFDPLPPVRSTPQTLVFVEAALTHIRDGALRIMNQGQGHEDRVIARNLYETANKAIRTVQGAR